MVSGELTKLKIAKRRRRCSCFQLQISSIAAPVERPDPTIQAALSTWPGRYPTTSAGSFLPWAAEAHFKPSITAADNPANGTVGTNKAGDDTGPGPWRASEPAALGLPVTATR
jgi:hypothetical protein